MNEIFLKYLNEDKNEGPECIKNYKNKRVIFKKEIDGKNYYIKKFCLPGRRWKLLALGSREDKVDRNIRISKKLEKLNTAHVKIIFSHKEKISFLQNISLMVTEEGGKILDDFVYDFENNKHLFIEFFNIFIKLCQNNIYPDDYCYINVLVNENEELVLYDLDEYTTRKFFITKKFRKKILQNLKDCLSENKIKKYKELVNFSYKEVERVKNELS